MARDKVKSIRVYTHQAIYGHHVAERDQDDENLKKGPGKDRSESGDHARRNDGSQRGRQPGQTLRRRRGRARRRGRPVLLSRTHRFMIATYPRTPSRLDVLPTLGETRAGWVRECHAALRTASPTRVYKYSRDSAQRISNNYTVKYRR